MSVLDTLSGEHALFVGLVKDLQNGLKYDEETARRLVRDVLLILLPALEKHEQIEDLVFGGASWPGRSTQRVAAELNKEHWRIALLRGELTELMKESSQCPFGRYQEKVMELAVKLHEHFLMEETRLWPRYRELAGRSVNRSLERRAQEQLKRLLREVERRKAMFSDLARDRP
ncbi:MAG: hemerythrin domain-containing protein [Elusimicrobia bacterium]|nr:hemerythrin domain-containing protein [Elusimicrobiota bacterium]